jgi:hypothetical protein
MTTKKVSATDEAGNTHDVLIDPNVTVDPSEGLPYSVRLEELGLPAPLLKRLYSELRGRGLTEPAQLLRSDASHNITLALMSAFQIDAQVIQSIAYRQFKK